ncbi:hypothetical protein EDD17DRAFT_1523790 [Pisolithus thermaeus]|nr:hypothetical protein EDD17DRAFT_1523790 [Pisolithus thermaeus]
MWKHAMTGVFFVTPITACSGGGWGSRMSPIVTLSKCIGGTSVRIEDSCVPSVWLVFSESPNLGILMQKHHASSWVDTPNSPIGRALTY